MGDTLSIPITKAKGQFIEVDPSELSDEVYQYILSEGLKVVLNARMAKIGAVSKLEGKELAAAQTAAMKIANENLDDLKEGKIKHSRGKAKSTIPAAVRAEAMRLAKTAIKDYVRSIGEKPSHYSEKAYTAKAKEYVENDPSYLTQAAINIDARKAVPTSVKFDLTDLGPVVKKASKAKAGELPAGVLKPTVHAAHKGASLN